MNNLKFVIGALMLVVAFSGMYYGGMYYENRLDVAEWKADLAREAIGKINRRLYMYETYHLESGEPIPQRFYVMYCLEGYPDSTGLYEYPPNCSLKDTTITVQGLGNE